MNPFLLVFWLDLCNLQKKVHYYIANLLAYMVE